MAEKRTYKGHFGLDTFSDPTILPSNLFKTLTNMKVEKGVLETREGIAHKSDDLGNAILGMQRFNDKDGNKKLYAGVAVPAALTGTLTFTTGSPNVTASGGAFTTELVATDRIKLDADDVWVEVSSVTNNDALVITVNYTGAGGAGAASRGDRIKKWGEAVSGLGTQLALPTAVNLTANQRAMLRQFKDSVYYSNYSDPVLEIDGITDTVYKAGIPDPNMKKILCYCEEVDNDNDIWRATDGHLQGTATAGSTGTTLKDSASNFDATMVNRKIVNMTDGTSGTIATFVGIDEITTTISGWDADDKYQIEDITKIYSETDDFPTHRVQGDYGVKLVITEKDRIGLFTYHFPETLNLDLFEDGSVASDEDYIAFSCFRYMRQPISDFVIQFSQDDTTFAKGWQCAIYAEEEFSDLLDDAINAGWLITSTYLEDDERDFRDLQTDFKESKRAKHRVKVHYDSGGRKSGWMGLGFGIGTAGSTGTTLIDSKASFTSALTGETIKNVTDGTSGTVTYVSSTQLTTTNNDWDVGDHYQFEDIMATELNRIYVYKDAKCQTPGWQWFWWCGNVTGDPDRYKVNPYRPWDWISWRQRTTVADWAMDPSNNKMLDIRLRKRWFQKIGSPTDWTAIKAMRFKMITDDECGEEEEGNEARVTIDNIQLLSTPPVPVELKIKVATFEGGEMWGSNMGEGFPASEGGSCGRLKAGTAATWVFDSNKNWAFYDHAQKVGENDFVSIDLLSPTPFTISTPAAHIVTITFTNVTDAKTASYGFYVPVKTKPGNFHTYAIPLSCFVPTGTTNVLEVLEKVKSITITNTSLAEIWIDNWNITPFKGSKFITPFAGWILAAIDYAGEWVGTEWENYPVWKALAEWGTEWIKSFFIKTSGDGAYVFPDVDQERTEGFSHGSIACLTLIPEGSSSFEVSMKIKLDVSQYAFIKINLWTYNLFIPAPDWLRNAIEIDAEDSDLMSCYIYCEDPQQVKEITFRLYWDSNEYVGIPVMSNEDYWEYILTGAALNAKIPYGGGARFYWRRGDMVPHLKSETASMQYIAGWGVKVAANQKAVAVSFDNWRMQKSGMLNGEYYYKVVFVNRDGNSSNPSYASKPAIVANSKILVTEIAAPDDDRIAFKELYRLGGTSTEWKHVEDLPVDRTSFEDNEPEDELGKILEAHDYREPPKAKVIELIDNSMWYLNIVDRENKKRPSRLYKARAFCPYQVSDSEGSDIRPKDGQEIVAAANSDYYAVVWKTKSTFVVDKENLTWDCKHPYLGCIAKDSPKLIDENTWEWLSHKGIVISTISTVDEKSGLKVKPLMHDNYALSVLASAVSFFKDDTYYLFYGANNEKGVAHYLPDNLWFSIVSAASGFNVQCAVVFDDEAGEVYAGSSDGYINHLFTGNSDFATNDIVSTIQTGDYDFDNVFKNKEVLSPVFIIARKIAQTLAPADPQITITPYVDQLAKTALTSVTLDTETYTINKVGVQQGVEGMLIGFKVSGSGRFAIAKFGVEAEYRDTI